MKVEDYFAMFNINSDEDQKRRFLETLAEKARRWASTISIDELKSYRYDEKESKEEKEKTFKWLFIKRFAKEGWTTHAAFEAWKNLKFDPAKDDVEEFMTTIKNLASTLAFNEEVITTEVTLEVDTTRQVTIIEEEVIAITVVIIKQDSK